jgi:hypothetical protein
MGTNINFNNILGISKGCSILLASTTPSLLLDTYTGAAVAYSLRQLRTAYTGAAIRVRRSSDNAEQDINFVSGDLDTQSLLDFVGYNLWTYSEDISQTTYSKAALNTTGTPPYIDVEIAPDGLTTGDKIIEAASNDAHQVARATGTILNTTDYNISVFLKQGERTKVQVLSQINGNQSCIVDLTNGTTSSNSFTNTPVVTSESNGWYRFSVTITSAVTSTTAGIVVRLVNASNQTTYLGDGTSGAYVWGFQLTKSSSVLTYEKTVADAARNGFITTWYDQSGNANNAAQAAEASQPRIVNGGVVEAVNGKSGIRWLTSPNNVLLSDSSIQELHNGSNSLVISLVTSNTSSATSQAIIGTCQNLSSNRGYYLRMLTNPGNINSTIRNGTSTLVSNNITTNIYPNNNQYLIIDKIDSSNSTLANRSIFNINGSSDINNNSQNGTPSTSNSTRTLMIGALLNDTFFRGFMQEIIIYPTDQSANRTAIETNINTHYNIYP